MNGEDRIIALLEQLGDGIKDVNQQISGLDSRLTTLEQYAGTTNELVTSLVEQQHLMKSDLTNLSRLSGKMAMMIDRIHTAAINDSDLFTKAE